MIKITLVVPSQDYIHDAANIFYDFFASNTEGHEEKYVFEEIVAHVEDVRKIKLDTDVIICRGLFAKAIKDMGTQVPIIEIPMSGTDLLHALLECKENFHCKQVGVIASPNMTSGAEDFAKILNMSIKAYRINSVKDREIMIKQAIANGCDVILGGYTTCRTAKSLKISCVNIATGEETFRQCLTEAKRVSQISRLEQEKAQGFKLILDYSHEGIISIDAQKHISTVNKQSKKILKLEKQIFPGQSIYDSQIPYALKRYLLDNREYFNEVITVDGVMLNFNKVNVIVKESFAGCVLTFQEVKKIIDLEGQIRKKIYSRGHVAKYCFDDIVGGSPEILRTVSTAKRFARTNSNILLLGQSGTGKEIFAQSIHNYSDRCNGPFVAVNCAALPENLLESELFGYADGAFTGAVKGGKPGFFELAHMGTIFLDEIGELPITLQSKLLRVIQEREVVRLGDKKVTSIDIRLICATNRDLEEQVRKGDFREDLYFRLNVLGMTIAPLCERRQDIPMLAERFLHKNFPDIALDNDANEVLMQYGWTGNIRELFNCCERLAVLCDSHVITAHDVLQMFNLQGKKGQDIKEAVNPEAENEKRRIIEALTATKYNRKNAAALLKMDRSTLWRKMKEYRL